MQASAAKKGISGMIEKIKKDPNIEKLFEGILKLETVDDCYKFFDDLCTGPELRSISQRFVVANMLIDGKIYNDIVTETGASTATISRVNRSLTDGNDGYKLVIEKLRRK